MNIQSLNELLSFMNSHPLLTLLALVWISVWKIIALWKAAKHNQLVIFIVISVVNTLGLLEIIYIAYLYFKDKKEIKK